MLVNCIQISISVMISISVQTFSAISPSKHTSTSFSDDNFNEFGNLSSASLKKMRFKIYWFFASQTQTLAWHLVPEAFGSRRSSYSCLGSISILNNQNIYWLYLESIRYFEPYKKTSWSRYFVRGVAIFSSQRIWKYCAAGWYFHIFTSNWFSSAQDHSKKNICIYHTRKKKLFNRIL